MIRSILVRRGNTLIEVTVATVLVGVVLVAALETLGSSVRSQRKSADVAEAWALAERYAAEIMAKPYEDPQGNVVFGRESNDGTVSKRDDLDDVDDYDNWTESPPKTSVGANLPRYTGWSVGVTVTRCASAPSGSTIGDAFTDQGIKRVQVRVTDAAGFVAELETMRSRYGASQYPTPLGLPQVGGVTVDLSVAGATTAVYGDQPLNEAPTP